MAWTPEARAKAAATRAENRKHTGARLGDIDDFEQPIEAARADIPHTETPVDDYRAQRIAELRARREKRSHDDEMHTTLHVPAHLKRGDMHYHWFNDQPGAGYLEDALANKYYDPVTCGELEQDDRNHSKGSRITRYVGSGPDGRPMHAVLCCKPKSWYDEDQLRQNAAHEELMGQISRREPVLSAEAGQRIDAANADAKTIYVPQEGRLPPA